MQIAELLHAFRSSECSTMFFRAPMGGDKDCFRNIDNGYCEGGVAISLSDRTYTGARMAVVINEMPVGQNPVEDFRMCVWDYETKALRAKTDNLAAEINAAPRLSAIPEGGFTVAADFIDPITLYEGERVILGNALYGQYPCRHIYIVNVVCMKTMMGWPPQLGFNRKSAVVHALPPNGYPSGDYEGGVPGPIGTDVAGNYPAMDLLPFP